MNADMKEIVDRESMHAALPLTEELRLLYKGHNRKVSNRKKV